MSTVYKQEIHVSYHFVTFITLMDLQNFIIPQISLFNNFFIKIESHSIIYILKNYFIIVFSFLVFSFSKNKLYLNRSQVTLIECFKIKEWK